MSRFPPRVCTTQDAEGCPFHIGEQEDLFNALLGALHLNETPCTKRSHLTDEEVAGYIDRSLTAPERDEVDGHLASCAECRAEVRAAAQIVRDQGRRAMCIRGSVLAAAAAAVALIVTNPFAQDETRNPTLRGPDAPLDVGDRLVTVVSPAEGASVQRTGLTFVWRPVEADARYRFTLTNVLGDDIWSADTRDTALMVPADVSLEPGERYLWYVDALLLDGRSVTTGTRRLELIR